MMPQMSPSEQTFGIILCFLSVLLLVLYWRIVYILVSRKHYRQHFCYRLVVQLGLVYCMVTPALILEGLRSMGLSESSYLAVISGTLLSTVVRAEVLLHFVLALDRLRVICGLKYLQAILAVLVFFTWTYSVSYAVIMLIFNFEPHLPSENTIPLKFVLLQKISTLLVIMFTTASITVYLMITIFLIRVRILIKTTIGYTTEMPMLFFGMSRFVISSMVTLSYNIVQLPSTQLSTYVTSTGHLVNYLFISVILQLLFFRTLRRQFFPCGKQNVPLTSVIPVTKTVRGNS
ncbi:hypothetical protein QR680_016225 [Steinernema hermaphroditum]|uniref:Uncharacterized protein n=1 Tax=Steinernema hermaphroditum TaxID=289476 RepID=A0AA39LM35_9BILA|nr:hypothetical protein QR680_016225 [Steinernema hermaphroditum]